MKVMNKGKWGLVKVQSVDEGVWRLVEVDEGDEQR